MIAAQVTDYCRKLSAKEEAVQKVFLGSSEG
jgi:hypothetical protein